MNGRKPVIRTNDEGTWWAFAAIGIAFLAGGLFVLIMSVIQPAYFGYQSLHPEVVDEIENLYRDRALLSMVLGFVTVAVSYGGYRRGEKWAWYAFLAFPVFFSLAFLFTSAPIGWAIPLIGSIVVLWISWRNEF